MIFPQNLNYFGGTGTLFKFSGGGLPNVGALVRERVGGVHACMLLPVQGAPLSEACA